MVTASSGEYFSMILRYRFFSSVVCTGMPWLRAVRLIGVNVRSCFRPAGLSGCVMTAEIAKSGERASSSSEGTPSYEVPIKIVDILFINV